ncbi:hypothetical protein PINS_up009982 [Pythium insidiosum]|nr:hypothetical protein PINS_up009982 [Pythium insidiosum]
MDVSNAANAEAASAKPHAADVEPFAHDGATPNDLKALGDVLLGDDLSLMGGDMDSWTTDDSSNNNNQSQSHSHSKNATATAPMRPSLQRPTSLPPTHPQSSQTPRQPPQLVRQQSHQPAAVQATSPTSATAQLFAAPPVQLTRHVSLPVSMMRTQQYQPFVMSPSHHHQMHHPHQHPHHAMHAAPTMMPMHPMVMAGPPALSRNRSHGYVMQMQPQHHAMHFHQPAQAFAMSRVMHYHHPSPLSSPMAMHSTAMPAPVPMVHTINLSVSQQRRSMPTVPVMTKQTPVHQTHQQLPDKSTGDSIEPIAFTGRLSEVRMSLGELDSLALAVLDESKDDNKEGDSKDDDEDNDMSKPSVASSIGCAQDLEKALDSLDKFLPEMDQELFQPSELRTMPSAAPLVTPRHVPVAASAGRAALPLLMSPHVKSLPSPASAMTMMMAHASLTPMGTTPRASPRVMATCKVAGCDRRVRSKGFCKTHGGGRKCSIEGCKKSSQNGEFCIGHGGGKKCKQEGCAKAAQSHGLCKAHGGGARCKYPDCNKSSQGGGLCRAHGGGKRCQASGCPKGAQRGNFCATHGGFRNCKIEGCVRTDRGGGFCEVHRRGRLCKIDGCKKLARNQGMCTMHIREEKQELTLSPTGSAGETPRMASTALSVA